MSIIDQLADAPDLSGHVLGSVIAFAIDAAATAGPCGFARR